MVRQNSRVNYSTIPRHKRPFAETLRDWWRRLPPEGHLSSFYAHMHTQKSTHSSGDLGQQWYTDWRNWGSEGRNKKPSLLFSRIKKNHCVFILKATINESYKNILTVRKMVESWPERRNSRRTASTAPQSAAYSDSNTHTFGSSLSEERQREKNCKQMTRELSKFKWKKVPQCQHLKKKISLPVLENKLPRLRGFPSILPGPEGKSLIPRCDSSLADR